MEKKCTSCNQILQLDAFVICKRNKDGRGSKCKPCHANACKQYAANNPDKRLNSSRKYYQGNKESHHLLVKKWRSENPETSKEIKKRFRANHPTEHIEYYKNGGLERLRKQRRTNQNKYKARNKVNNAVAKGEIPKVSELTCNICGELATEYHHHKGYDEMNWLEVIPVCTPCHRSLDS